MKKNMTFILGLLIGFSLTGCNSIATGAVPDFNVTTSFSFYQDGDKETPFEGNTFEINTKIYVCVDFTITKNVGAEEIISFVVQIPYAEYYSTKDYYSGTVKPHENPYTQQDSYGNEYTVMELNQMNFVIDDKESHDYHYIFEIEANQVCESADFIVRFKPENSNLSVMVNGVNDNKAKTTYTFKSKED